MTVRSKRFLLTQRVAAVQTLYYTVPAGKTAIIKEWLIANATAVQATLLETDDGSAADNHRMGQWIVPANTTLRVSTWSVYGPGETIWLGASVANTVCVTLSGALLEGVAP